MAVPVLDSSIAGLFAGHDANPPVASGRFGSDRIGLGGVGSGQTFPQKLNGSGPIPVTRPDTRPDRTGPDLTREQLVLNKYAIPTDRKKQRRGLPACLAWPTPDAIMRLSFFLVYFFCFFFVTAFSTPC